MKVCHGLIGAAGLALAWPGAATAFTVSHTIEGLGTRETATREIAGVVVTYPVDEADVVDQLETDLKAFMGRRHREAAEEAKLLVEAYQSTEMQSGIRQTVSKLLGGRPLGPEAKAALAEGMAEIAVMAERWQQWSGSVAEIRFWNRGQMLDRFGKLEGSPVVLAFDQLRYELSGKGFQFAFLNPVTRTAFGLDWFDPKREAVSGMRIDLPIPAPPGTDVGEIVKAHRAFLDEFSRLLRAEATERFPRGITPYLVEKVMVREIGAGLFGKAEPGVVANGLARLYLIPYLVNTLPGGRDEAVARIGEMLSFALPEGEEAERRFFEDWAKLDPLGEVPPGMEVAASRLLAAVVVELSQGESREGMPLVIMESMGINVSGGGLDRAGMAAAFEQVYPEWETKLGATRAEIGRQLREAAAQRNQAAAADPHETTEEEARYPESYETFAVDGLTFRFPPELAGAVAQIGPVWAADLRRAREILKERFSARWREVVELTEADYTALGGYGIEPNRDEAVIFSLSMGLVANLDRWVVRLVEGNEAGIWFRDDLQAALGDQGRFGGVDFDFVEESLAISLPRFRLGKEVEHGAKVSDLVRIVEGLPPMVYPVLLDRADAAGKSRAEQMEAIEKGDQILRTLCKGAAEIDPAGITGQTDAPILTAEQSFFVVVHEVFESALVNQVVASPDRRWFCDGLANLVAIRECDRCFGAGAGLAAFEFLFDPESCRALATEVNLPGWQAVEGESPNLAAVKGVAAAHYYFATLAMLEAIAGTDDDFIGQWIGEIRATSWNRVNAKTVMAAYQSLTDRPLEPTLRGVVKPE